MKTSIKEELKSYLLDLIEDEILTDYDKDDWHFYAFNNDYYITGYYNASQWLKKHKIDPFEAIEICQQWERDNFGEISSIYDNPETTVNMLAYIYGEELLYCRDWESVQELKEYCND